jgi:hypothetical protein
VPIPDPNAPAGEPTEGGGAPSGTPTNPITVDDLNAVPDVLADVGVTDVTENHITQIAELLRRGERTASQVRVELVQTGRYTAAQRDAIVALAEQRARMIGNRR